MQQQNDQSGKVSPFPTFKKWSESFDIVRLTGWLLILYGLSPFAFPIIRKAIYGPGYGGGEPLGIAIFFPIIIAGILYIFLGSFWLLEAGYWLLHNNIKGIRIGGRGIFWMLPLGLYAVATTLFNKPLVWVKTGGEGYGTNIEGIIFTFIYIIFNVFLVWGLGTSAKILNGRHT